MNETVIQLPHNWVPRDYQLPVMRAMQRGIKRACLVWPRRFGKDTFALNFTAMQAQQRVGTYLHFLPFATQARKVVWQGINRDGVRMIDQAFPEELRANVREQEMSIEFKNGSMWYAAGSDNYDSLMGTNPVGIVLSEYAIADPMAWNYMRPILAENEGWMLAIYTPRGHNHGYEMYQQAQTNPLWFCERLSLETTQPYPVSVVEEEIQAGMDPALAKQEFYTSFEAPNQGTFFGDEMEAMQIQKRLTAVPYETQMPVHTAWDLGISDDTTIILFQQLGNEVRIVDFISDRGKGLAFYVDLLNKRKELHRFSWGSFLMPHDIVVRELGSGQTRLRTLKTLMEGQGVANWKTGVQMKYPDTLVPIRAVLPRVWIDRTRCDHLIQALRSYHREYDEKSKSYRDKPHHGWESHPVDAARELAIYCTRGRGRAGDQRRIDAFRKDSARRGRVSV